jgi:hypothetical protein
MSSLTELAELVDLADEELECCNFVETEKKEKEKKEEKKEEKREGKREAKRKGKEEETEIEDIDDDEIPELIEKVKVEGKKNQKRSTESIGKIFNDASMNVSSEQVMKELNQISQNPDQIDSMISKMGADKDLAKLMKGKDVASIANDPKIKKMAEDAKKNISRKQALKMNKALTKGLNKGNKGSVKVDGVMVNLGKKLKPYSVEFSKSDGEEVWKKLDLEQLARTLNAQDLCYSFYGEYLIYYDSKSPDNNKVAKRLFPGITLGNQIIVFKKDFTPLSIDTFDKKK